MFDSMNEALKLRSSYEDTYILGKVVNNVDVSATGASRDRVQVAAPGLYDPDKGEVPWAGPMKFSPFGIGKDWGVYGAPYPGSDVILELQGGNANYPFYHSIQRYSAPAEFSKPGKEWGFKDPRGNVLHVDLENGEIYFKASSGVAINIGSDGSLTIESSGGMTLKAPTLDIAADIRHSGTLTSNGVNIGSTHIHRAQGNSSPTSAPL